MYKTVSDTPRFFPRRFTMHKADWDWARFKYGPPPLHVCFLILYDTESFSYQQWQPLGPLILVLPSLCIVPLIAHDIVLPLLIRRYIRVCFVEPHLLPRRFICPIQRRRVIVGVQCHVLLSSFSISPDTFLPSLTFLPLVCLFRPSLPCRPRRPCRRAPSC